MYYKPTVVPMPKPLLVLGFRKPVSVNCSKTDSWLFENALSFTAISHNGYLQTVMPTFPTSSHFLIFSFLTLPHFLISTLPHFHINYSVFKLFTGLATAVFTAWYPMVIIAMNKARHAARVKDSQPIGIR